MIMATRIRHLRFKSKVVKLQKGGHYIPMPKDIVPEGKEVIMRLRVMPKRQSDGSHVYVFFPQVTDFEGTDIEFEVDEENEEVEVKDAS